MVQVFGAEYQPNAQDTERLLAIGEARGFSRMLDQLIACIGNGRTAPKVCEEWSHNDINGLQRSPVFRELCNGESLLCNYTVNGREYNMRYYPVGGIYPQLATFVKTISEPLRNKQSLFATMQEATRKDVKRAFRVLQDRWGTVRGAAMMWKAETLWPLKTCCVILHNMTVDDEGDGVAQTNDFEAPGEQVKIPEDKDVAQLNYELSADASESSISSRARVATQ
ncbi:uncharacterized protein [Aegilops tauschii subsp. strangulata]|uniref:uncharacterized protein n=1 Tax=Aegilops tauschii subsp. strangulata TaxID=200361 RepID=UPI003CC86A38